MFSAEADKRTLIRRLSFDLRGLPPSVEEVETHFADSSPEAWGDLVDRFIADPVFGERFSWPWLDAARSADSNGYQGDRERTMWPWRDWVKEGDDSFKHSFCFIGAISDFWLVRRNARCFLLVDLEEGADRLRDFFSGHEFDLSAVRK
jgi:hypothetical protein